ncbi:unnamed protein product [Durusdinium trenchii]|uniref:Uncharacterized protein n=2 Tax=Durusdinium trenchii TaxID=1381693 RepID=A0ABP0RXZ6_9DINO
MNSPRAWWQLPDGDGDDDHGEEAKVHILAEPGTPARSQSSGTGTEGLAEGWQSLRLASSTMRSSEMKSKPKRFQQVLNQWIRRPPDRERLHRLAKPVRRKTQEASFELTLVHPNRTFDTTRLVELAAPKQEKKPVPLAPQLRRPLNLIRLKELAEPQLRRRPEKTIEIASRLRRSGSEVHFSCTSQHLSRLRTVKSGI